MKTRRGALDPRPHRRDARKTNCSHLLSKRRLAAVAVFRPEWHYGPVAGGPPRSKATWQSVRRQAIELDYVRRASLKLDAAIMVRTLKVMFVIFVSLTLYAVAENFPFYAMYDVFLFLLATPFSVLPKRERERALAEVTAEE